MSDDFSFEMDFEGDDIDRDGKGGGTPLAEGSYCLQVTEIEPHTEKTGDMKVTLEVRSGTVASEVGKTHFEYISYPQSDLSDDANNVRKSIIRRFFYAVKLTTPDEIKANPKVKIDLGLAIGRQCCGKCVHDVYNDKPRAKFFHKGGDLFAVDSPKAAGIPMPTSTNGNTAPPAADDSTFGDIEGLI